MGRALRCSVVATAVLLSAANAPAQVVRGNDTGGIIPWSCANEATAREVAEVYCARWDKFARISSVHRYPGDYIAFNCLWRPDIGRYEVPAVGTRASCYPRRSHRHRRRDPPRD